MATPKRRKNPVGLAIGVGVVGLVAAAGVWWFVSRRADDAMPDEAERLSDREFDKARAKAAAAQAAAARGGDKVGISHASLMANTTLRAAGPRFEPSEAT